MNDVEIPDSGKNIVGGEHAKELSPNLASAAEGATDCSDVTPLVSTMKAPSSRVSTLAVVDDHDYLIPVLTASDLLQFAFPFPGIPATGTMIGCATVESFRNSPACADENASVSRLGFRVSGWGREIAIRE